MPDAVPQISDAEWEVMKVVWEADDASPAAALTAGEVVQRLGAAGGAAGRVRPTAVGAGAVLAVGRRDRPAAASAAAGRAVDAAARSRGSGGGNDARARRRATRGDSAPARSDRAGGYAGEIRAHRSGPRRGT